MEVQVRYSDIPAPSSRGPTKTSKKIVNRHPVIRYHLPRTSWRFPSPILRNFPPARKQFLPPNTLPARAGSGQQQKYTHQNTSNTVGSVITEEPKTSGYTGPCAAYKHHVDSSHLMLLFKNTLKKKVYTFTK